MTSEHKPCGCTTTTNTHNDSDNDNDNNKLQSFHQWIKRSGIDAPKLCIRYNNDNNDNNNNPERGIYTTQEIQNGETIARIPLHLCINRNVLQTIGSDLLLRHGCDDDYDGTQTMQQPLSAATATTEVRIDYETKNGMRTTEGEDRVLMILERFRRYVVQQQQPSQWSSHGEGVPDDDDKYDEDDDEGCGGGGGGYQWNDDDALSLFLMATRTLLSSSVSSLSTNHDSYNNNNNNNNNNNQDTIEPHPSPSPFTTTTSMSITWLPYIAMLPSTFPTHPTFYNPQQLQRIEGTDTYEFAIRTKSQMYVSYNTLCSVFDSYWKADHEWLSQVVLSNHHHDHDHDDPSSHTITTSMEPSNYNTEPSIYGLCPDILTFESYQWARTVVYSRATDQPSPFFSSPSKHDNDNQNDNDKDNDDDDDDDGTNTTTIRTIVPLADFLNHSTTTTATTTTTPVVAYCTTNPSDQTLSIHSNTNTNLPLPPNTEICWSYGSYSNESLLSLYGFVVPNNPHETVRIYAPLPDTDPYYRIKVGLLWSRCGRDDPNQPFVLGRDVPLPDDLVWMLRLIGIRDVEDLVRLSSTLPSMVDTNDDDDGLEKKKEEDVDADDKNHNDKDSDQGQLKRPRRRYGIPFLSAENEYHALTALQTALETMARQTALNLIDDTGLGAASIDVRGGGGGVGTLSPTTQTLMEERNRDNARVLCEGRYEILRLALEKVEERLEEGV